MLIKINSLIVSLGEESENQKYNFLELKQRHRPPGTVVANVVSVVVVVVVNEVGI